MKQFLATALLMLTAMMSNVRAQEPYYLISGTVSNPPPINATTVENIGNVTTFNTQDILFDFENLQNFVNRSFINATPGIEFDYFTPTQYLRGPLTNFVNEQSIIASTRLLINSASVQNRDNALLQTSRAGLLSISGTTVDLQGGRVSAGDGTSYGGNATEGNSEFFISSGGNRTYYYYNPANIRDDLWGSTNGGTISLPFMNQGGVAPGESDSSTYPSVPSLTVSPNYLFFASTNNFIRIDTDTIRNTVQMVFVRTNAASPEITVSFLPSTNSVGFSVNDIAVDFGITDVDPVSGQTYQRYLELYDESLAVARPSTAGLNTTLFLENNYPHPGYFRPRAYSLYRTDSPLFGGFFQAASQPYTNGMIYPGSGNFNERFITNQVPYNYSAWGFTVNPIDFGGDVSGLNAQLSDPTNSLGRLQINAANLNLSYSTLKADNLLTVVATNGLNLAGATLSAPNVTLQVPGATDLVISNNFADSVVRLNGSVQVWSGVWRIDQRITNVAWFPGFTGTVEHAFHVMVVDNTLITNTPVVLRNFNVQSPQVVVGDGVTFGGSLNIGGVCLIIPTNGSVTLNSENTDFNAQDAPNLSCFMNDGVFTVPLLASLGADRTIPYSNVVNNGQIFVGSLLVNSKTVTNTGSIFTSSGTLGITANTNYLNGGVLQSAGNIALAGDHLSVTGAVLNTSQKLTLQFTNFLGDNQVTNIINVTNGFSLLTHPNKGDLMATHITTTATASQNRFHTWAGENRGATASGYANNTAIQHLTMNGGTGSRFFFSGTGSSNAMYVNYLEFLGSTTNASGLQDSSTMVIDPSLTIYFADSNVPEDKLTNNYGGRLVWVDSSITAGPSVAVPTTSGQYTYLTTRQFQTMLPAGGDFDGDGIENERDTSPLSGFTVSDVTVINLPPLTSFIKWQAKSGVTYTIEYRDGLESDTWHTLYSIQAQDNKEITAIDVPSTGGQRFYRVRFTLSPN